VAALLHDIGKQKIPAYILGKPGPLTAAEMDIMKTHTAHGAEMLANVQGELGATIRAVCLYHHERHDGGGYWGKQTSEVPAYVPLVSIADVFTALISERPYKKPWSVEAALEYIQKQAGAQFSRELAGDFLSLIQGGGY
jgi:putative two-component system response regulator